MGNSNIETFSCPKKKDAMITQAQDKAKQEGKSWSEYVVDLIEADCKKQTQDELHQQATNGISIFNNGQQQQKSITEFIPRLYTNNIERDQQFDWIQTVDNDQLIEFTQRNKDTTEMIRHRRFNESLKAAERARIKKLQKAIPNIDTLIDTNYYGITTSANQDQDNSIPNELDGIPIVKD